MHIVNYGIPQNQKCERHVQSSNQSNYHHRVVSLRFGLDSPEGYLAPFPLGCGLTANY